MKFRQCCAIALIFGYDALGGGDTILLTIIFKLDKSIKPAYQLR